MSGNASAERGSGLRVAILTVSDRVSGGEAPDGSGDLVEEWCRREGHEPVRRIVVPDGTEHVVPVLVKWADGGEVDVILTTGGTGFTARDRTPEATDAVLERTAPGLAEALRRHGAEATPMAALSRGRAGSRGRCLIVNLPGGRGGVSDGLEALAPILVHAARLAQGTPHPHHHPSPAAGPTGGPSSVSGPTPGSIPGPNLRPIAGPTPRPTRGPGVDESPRTASGSIPGATEGGKGS